VKNKLNEELDRMRVLSGIKNSNSVEGFLHNIGVINEISNKDVVNEGWREVVLATALLLGVGLKGDNKAFAQDALKKTEVLMQVKNTLESDKIKDVANSLEAAGLKNAMEKIEKNADKLEKNYENISKSKLKVKTTTAKDGKELAKKVELGYAIKDIRTTNDTIVKQDTIEIITKLPIQIKMQGDDLFNTANYTLNEISKDKISNAIEAILSSNGKIIKVHIESSTDTEPIKMGNEKLSNLRANSIKELLNSFDINDVSVEALHDIGPNVYSATMSKEERVEARKNTAEYRYVKLNLDVEYPVVTEKETNEVIEVVEKNVYELVRVIKKSSPNIKIKIGKPSCKKAKKGGKPYACPTF
jgi:outer membrane protein OmpA-like peptidoglycan-associated protein